MDKWDLVVTHPFGLAALGLSLLFYFIAARRRGWQESRVMNYVFGVLAVGVLVGGLALARREITKPRPKAKVEPRTVGVTGAAPPNPAARPREVRRPARGAKRPEVPAEGGEAKGPETPGVEEPKRPEAK